MFIENVGQWDAGARFQVRGGAGTMWLAEDALWITVVEQSADDEVNQRVDPTVQFEPDRAEIGLKRETRKAANIKLSFVGANSHPRMEPFGPLDTVISYFIGDDPAQWRPDVPVWGGVRYMDLYPGVDLEFTSEDGQMVQRLAARPGADLGAVRLRVEGADDLAVDGLALRLSTAAGVTALPLLEAETSSGSAVVQHRRAQSFDVDRPFARVDAYESARIARPNSPADNSADLLYGTYLGGGGWEHGYGIVLDEEGNAYAVGYTSSPDFPTTPGVVDPNYGGGYDDVFVLRLSPSGNRIDYATFLGGSADDWGMDLAVDTAGHAYVTGWTGSADFPTTPDGFDPDNDGSSGTDSFLVKLNPTGTSLIYSTFLGGRDEDYARDIAIDVTGSAYVTGRTYSGDFPVTPDALDTSFSGGAWPNAYDAFVAKVNPGGNALAYATFVGGTSRDDGYGIAVDKAGCAYVTGTTYSSDFPVTADAFDTSFNGGEDAFVVKLNSEGSTLSYATFLGGSENDYAYAVALDATGGAHVTGESNSIAFPTTPGAFDRSVSDSGGFLVKLNATGSELVFGTGLQGGHGFDLAMDETGCSYITGVTYSSVFPATTGAFDRSFNAGGFADAFIMKVNPAGSGLAYATFLGGSGDDWGYGIAVDEAGHAYVSGSTGSTDFPATSGAYNANFSGGTSDAFLVKLAMTGTGGEFAVSGTVGAGGQPVEGVQISVGTAGTVSTDASGGYTVPRLAAGTYTIAPSKPGYSFSPPNRTVSISGEVAEQDFYGVATTPFLDLPFAYDGTPASFVTALYDEDHGGRVRSWFDHDLPNYKKNEAVLLYDGRERTRYPYNPGLGCYEGRCYDGHNGLDFKYADPQAEAPGDQPLPIHPAGDGVVATGGVAAACNDTCRYPTCAACGSYGNYVVVNHQNGYFTRYAHLSSVSVNADQPVTTNDVLGTMGTTGHSTGVHLHFSVHLDSNGNGQWGGESVDKPLDPCGYLGESDPWVTNGGPVSAQLWEYACAPGQQALVSTSVGATVTDVTGRATAEIPAGALSGSALLNLAPGPVAGASAQLRSTGGSFWLRLLEWLSGTDGQVSAVALSAPSSMAVLQQPITLTVAYDEVAVSHLDVSQLTLRRWNEDQKDWQALPSEVDPVNRVIAATSQYLGDYDLQAPLLCTTDAREPDDGYASAAPFWPNDLPLARGLDIPQDSDWMRFHALQGASYTLRTHNLADGADTVLTLYDTDGLTALASNDDSGSDPASELTWTAPHAGNYFVEVASAPSGATSCSTTYRLSITTTNNLRVTIARTPEGALLTWPRDPKYAGYQVRRSTAPSFTANDWSNLLTEIPMPASGDTVSYLDTSAFDSPPSSYFYVVLPADADGEPYLVSNRVGVFNYDLFLPLVMR